jgi:hypothetical protein
MMKKHLMAALGTAFIVLICGFLFWGVFTDNDKAIEISLWIFGGIAVLVGVPVLYFIFLSASDGYPYSLLKHGPPPMPPIPPIPPYDPNRNEPISAWKPGESPDNGYCPFCGAKSRLTAKEVLRRNRDAGFNDDGTIDTQKLKDYLK